MKSFEAEVKAFLNNNFVLFGNNGKSYDLPDLAVTMKSGLAHVELKEKRQAYTADNWPLIADETDSFIVDEFSVRKLMMFSPSSFLLVRDNTSGMYYLADIYSLAFMPKSRCNRRQSKFGTDEIFLKGKWCLDFKNFVCYAKLMSVFVAINNYLKHPPTDRRHGVDCWHPFYKEDLEIAGTIRTDEQRSYDVEATR